MTGEQFNTLVLVATGCVNLWIAWRTLFTTRSVLKTNRRLIQALDSAVETLQQGGEIIQGQRHELEAVHKAALFWYVQWLQAVAK